MFCRVFGDRLCYYSLVFPFNCRPPKTTGRSFYFCASYVNKCLENHSIADLFGNKTFLPILIAGGAIPFFIACPQADGDGNIPNFIKCWVVKNSGASARASENISVVCRLIFIPFFMWGKVRCDFRAQFSLEILCSKTYHKNRLTKTILMCLPGANPAFTFHHDFKLKSAAFKS